MKISVSIAGARGKMGKIAIQAIEQTKDIEVVSLLDYKNDRRFLGNGHVNSSEKGYPIYTSFEELVEETKPDVFLDLTNPEVVYQHTEKALQLGVRPVIGTSGLQIDQVKALAQLSKEKNMGCIIAPNFSIGAVLLMKFSAMAARYLSDIEIIELHHDEKVDAPSGTAIKTAEMITKLRRPHRQGHPEEEEKMAGARGADVDGMKIHSVRLRGLLAHQEVLLGGEGELLTLRHDSFNRSSFMEGIVLSIRHVEKINELIYGLENIID